MECKEPKKLVVTSDAFAHDDEIPVRYTGRGADVSPSLALSELSGDAKSIAGIMNDLDHPIHGYNHWVIWNGFLYRKPFRRTSPMVPWCTL